MEISLVVIKSGKPGRAAALPMGSSIVGRDDGCRLRIPAAAVSRRHCEFEVTEDGVTLRDLGSSNGTFVNGERLEDAPEPIAAGDIIAIGEMVFFLRVNGEPEEPRALQKSKPSKPAKKPASGEMTAQKTSTEGKNDLGSVLDDLDFDPSEDSSVVDFDFDLDDDKGPKL